MAGISGVAYSHVASSMGDHNTNPCGSNYVNPANKWSNAKQRLSPADVTPAQREHIEKIKRQNFHLEVGEPRLPGTPKDVWDHLREFHYNHKTMSVAAGMCAIVALASTLGLATGWVIDELAHVTDRKNDKVGFVIGVFVGFTMALTQTVSLFALARKGEMRFRARSFAGDTTTPEGQATQIVARRSPVLFAAMMRNAMSLRGTQHERLVFLDTHVRDAMNFCIGQRFTKNEWGHSIEEVTDPQEIGNRAYWQATADCPASGFVKGRYYVSRHKDVTAFLESELAGSFNENETTRVNIVNDAQSCFGKPGTPEEKFENFKKLLISRLGTQRIAAGEASSMNIAALNKVLSDNKHYQFVFHNTDFEKAAKQIYDGATSVDSFSKFISLQGQREAGADMGAAADACLANRLILRLIDSLSVNPTGVTKSFVRIDEVTKAKPNFSGLRPASLHTWLANNRDAFFSFTSTAGNLETQAGVAGNQIWMFIPFTIITSVVSVLCLGMSSTSPLPNNSSGGNVKNGQMQNVTPTIGMFPSFEGGNVSGMQASAYAKHSAQQNAYNQTPLMLALNQSPNYPMNPAFSTMG